MSRITYFAASGPLYFLHKDDVVMVKCLVQDYEAVCSVAAFQNRALPRLMALGRYRGESYSSLPVHRVYRDLSENLRIVFGEKEGIVSRMLG